MKTVLPSRQLKIALTADAIVGATIALLHLALPSWLASLLMLPAALLLGTGLFLAGYAVMLVLMARSGRLPRALVQFVVIGNVGWAGACFALMLGDAVAPNPLGLGYLVIHMVSVLAFAALEFAGLRSSALQQVQDRARVSAYL